MANQRVTVELVVTDKGTLRLVEGQLNKLGQSVNKTERSQRNATKAAGEFYDTQKKGVIGTANSTKSFSKMAETIGGNSSGVVGAYATLAANIFAVSAAFMALRNAAQVEQVMMGLEALGQRTGRSLGVAADNVEKLSGYTLSAEQAMRSTAQVMSAGFSTTQLERITAVANDASFALGRNMTDSMDRLSRGIIKLEPELLDELGIMTRIDDATSAYAVTLGKSATQLTAFERRTAFANAALTEGELKFGDLAEAAGNTRAYDQLSSTMANSTKTVLNLLNTALLPVAEILSNNPAALGGLALLFAGGLRNQLLPAMSEWAAKSRVVAEASKEMAKAQQVAANTAINKAKADQQAAIASTRVLQNIKGGPKIWNDLTKKINEGTASLQDYEKAERSLARSIETHQRQLGSDDPRFESPDAIARKSALIDDIKGQQAAITSLKDAEQKLGDEQIRSVTAVQSARNAANSAAYKARAQDKAANAINLAAHGELRKSFQQLTLATTVYGRSQAAANGGAASGLGVVRTAAYSAALGVRVLGTAFLNAIPIIGQIVFAAGLLYAAFDWVTQGTKEQEEYNEKLKELDEMMANASKRGESYSRIMKSLAPETLKQQQRFELLSNTIGELASKYQEVQDAANAVEAARIRARDTKTDPVTDFLRSELSQFSDSREELRKMNMKVEDIPLYSTLKDLAEHSLPEIRQATEKELKKYGGLDSIAKWDDTAKAAQVLDKSLSRLVDRFVEVGPAAKALGESYGELEKSFVTFTRSSIASTPFDDLILKLNSTRDAIKGVNIALLESESFNNVSEISAALSGIGANTSSILDSQTRQALSSYRSLAPELQALINKQEEQQAIGKDLNSTELARLATVKNIITQDQRRLVTIYDQINSFTALTSSLQEQVRNGKAILALEQARSSAISRTNLKTVESLKAQHAQEDRIRGIQIQQEKLQLKLLDIQAQKNQENLRNLETEMKLNKTYRDNHIMMLKMQAISGNTLAALSLPEEERKANVENLKLERELESLKSSMVDIESSRRGVLLQIQTIQDGAANAEQRSAEINDLITGQLIEQNQVLEEARTIGSEMLQTSAKIAILETGRAQTLRQEIALSRSQLAIEKENLKAQTSRTIQKLESDKQTAVANARRQGTQAAEARHYDSLIERERAMGQLHINQIELQQVEAELSKSIFDDRKEGLEWQQEGLDLMQRAVELEGQLGSEILKNSELRARVDLRRRGLAETESFDQSLEIRAAQQAYELAVREADVKKAMIDLEYALIEAQRQMLVEELRTRKELLATKPGNENRVSQLDSAINKLESVSTNGMADVAKATIEMAVRNAREELTRVTLPEAFEANSILSEMAGIEAKARARRDAEIALATSQVARAAIEIVKPIENAVDAQVEAGLTAATDIISSNANLITAITGLTQTISSFFKTVNTDTATATDAAGRRGNIKAEFDYVNSLGGGFRADELNVKSGHSRGSKHYTGEAFDVNIGKGNIEANNPEMRARMDKLAEYFTKQGYNVLWKTAGHFNHLHVSITKEMAAQARASANTAAIEMQDISRTAQEEIEGANITVTAQRPKGPDFGNTNIGSADISGLVGAPEMEMQVEKTAYNLQDKLAIFATLSSKIREQLGELGPEGEVITALVAGMESVILSTENMMKRLGDKSAEFHEKFSAVGAVVSSALSMVQNMSAASTDAIVANIDRQIAAEQKRDGKSAESVAKIQGLEKKKDQVAKKQFDTNKKLMMAQAVISTATGIAQALSYGFPLGPVLAGMIGAMGAAQLAIIAGTQYQSSGAASASVSSPSNLTIGRRGEAVDLARRNNSPGGELGYLRGTPGTGQNASNYSLIGSAYGGAMGRGYGNRGFVVGEKGPEVIEPDVPLTVRPANDNASSGNPVTAEINIRALDASGVEKVLNDQRGNIISMLREAANASGDTFMEDVNVNFYSRPNIASKY